MCRVDMQRDEECVGNEEDEGKKFVCKENCFEYDKEQGRVG